MQGSRHRNGMGERPFRQGSKTKAERKEDEFMRLHGGAGPRTIYRVVCLIEAAFLAFGRKDAGVRKRRSASSFGRPVRTHP